MISAKPADWFWVNCSNGARIVSATDPAPMSDSTVINSSVLPCWPKIPSSETSASNAGNRDSTA